MDTSDTSLNPPHSGDNVAPLSRRRFVARAAAIAAAAPLAGAIAACSNDGDGSSGGFSSPAPSTTSTNESSPKPGKTKEPTKLSGSIVIAINSNPPKQARNALTKAYHQHQPDVAITWQTKDFGGASNYVSYLGTQLAAGNIKPDLVSGNYAKTFGNYVNFDEYRKTTNPYTGHAWDHDLNFDFTHEVNTTGERIMVPTQSVHISWYYNKDLFAKANVSPPRTWTDFADVCQKLQAAGITPISVNYDYELPQWMAEIYFDQYHVDWVKTVRAQKGDWNYVPSLDGKFKYKPNDPNLHNSYTYNVQRFYKALQDKKLRYDTPRVEAIVENMRSIFPKYATKDIFVLEDNYAPFLQQHTAMMISGSWSLLTLTNDLKSLSPERLKELKIKAGSIKPFKWDTFENPPMQGKLVQSKVRSVESSSGEYVSVINKDSKSTAVDLDFVMFWLSKAGYQPYMDGYVKSGEWAPSGPVEISGLKQPAVDKVFDRITMLGNAEVNYNGFWTGGATAAQTEDLHNMLKDVLQSKITAKQYATNLQAYFQDHFDDILKAASLTQADIDNPARRPSGS